MLGHTPSYMLIIIIIKTSSTGPIGKNKVVYKLLAQPQKDLCHGKLKKTQLKEATNGCFLEQPMVASHPAFRCQTQRIEGHSTIETEPIRKTSQIGTFYT